MRFRSTARAGKVKYFTKYLYVKKSAQIKSQGYLFQKFDLNTVVQRRENNITD
jgi:hypothetical protein